MRESNEDKINVKKTMEKPEIEKRKGKRKGKERRKTEKIRLAHNLFLISVH